MTDAAPVPAEAPPTIEPRWGLGDVVFGWFAVQLFSQIWAIAILAATDHLGEGFDALPLTVVALAQLGLAFAFFAVPYVVTKVKGNGLVIDLGFWARWPDVWKGGIAGALGQLVVIPLLYWPILQLIDKSASDLEAPATSLGDRAQGATGAVLLVLIVGVLAPIFEELFYRGLVQRAFLKRGLPPAAAIGVTALLFGLSHFQLLQLPGLVFAGLLFGVLAHRSGRLGPAIAAHVAFNMVTVVTLLVT